MERYPESKYFSGYANVPNGIGGQPNTVYGSIDDADFEHEGTQYKVQALFRHHAFPVLYLKVDPHYEPTSTKRPTLMIQGETYHGQDTFLGVDLYVWTDVELDWDVGHTVPFPLFLATVFDAHGEPQSSANSDAARAVNALSDSDGGVAVEEEEVGGFPGWAGWLAGVGAAVVASIGYAGYRFLR